MPTIDAPRTGPITVDIDAKHVDVTVTVDPRATRASLSYSEATVQESRSEANWSLALTSPNTGSSTTHSGPQGDVTNYIGGNISPGSRVVQAGNLSNVTMTSEGISASGTSPAGGSAKETVQLTLPEGSSLTAFLQHAKLTASGGKLDKVTTFANHSPVTLGKVRDLDVRSSHGKTHATLTEGGKALINSQQGNVDLDIEHVDALLVSTEHSDLKIHWKPGSKARVRKQNLNVRHGSTNEVSN